MVFEWIALVFVFAFGACVGSFLNVVIWRLPRNQSLVRPRSACPGCGTMIAWYDNVPLLSWLDLRGKCRTCGMKISIRYPIIELVTAMIFLGLYLAYFWLDMRNVGYGYGHAFLDFWNDGWIWYVCHVALLSALLAASAIDLELWVIPLSLCWFVTVLGMICSGMAPWIMPASILKTFRLFPSASSMTGALALGGMIGLAVALAALRKGLIPRSYPEEETNPTEGQVPEANPAIPDADDDRFDHRREILKELLFLAPIVLGAVSAMAIYRYVPAAQRHWDAVIACPMTAGFFGSLWGYLIGCGTVWATRILGTLAFGREAMGLGDVHLMGAAGAVIGAEMAVMAFFIAPFFGLVWAINQWIFKKTRQIPYGPFLSMAVALVMIAGDWFWNTWSRLCSSWRLQ